MAWKRWSHGLGAFVTLRVMPFPYVLSMLGQDCDGPAAMAASRGDTVMLKALARIQGARPASDRLPLGMLVSQWLFT